MATFRHGQWVKFTGDFDDAFHDPQGKVVGIYQRAGRDATGQVHPAFVAVVDPQGRNLVRFEDGEARPVRLAPGECADLQGCASRDDIPEARLEKMHPEFAPQA